MLTLKKLRRRIRSVKNTKQITRAMEMVSAAKLRRAELSLKSFRPYAEGIETILCRLLKSRLTDISAEQNGRQLYHPLLESRGSERILLVIITSDRGLCGAFNHNIIAQAEEFIERQKHRKEIKLLCVGRRGYSWFRKQDIEIVDHILDLVGRVTVKQSQKLSQQLQSLFLQQKVDEVYMLYASFVSRATQRPTIERILPVETEDLLEKVKKLAVPANIDYILEPDFNGVLKELIPLYLNTRVHLIMAEAFTSEHSARMIAMTNATRNCEEMVDHLTLQLNKARQAAITKELLDIVGGAEALRSR